ncbi:pPIWI_RE module domain-containing protein [Paenibacillus tianjinensis]|uniref:DUF3962 domain-containing protein n=1 Tax=Paenibacillus tianjinensis TaxID=2810347 RepID=A0ABX7LDS7_9BACL|nr:DUF3962 domain-containing protein [Paenibacillus tianjinensis]QSF46192.1 DUF3962 domain-containing protein [Paenibacillus tianjinensis]
MSRSKSTQLQLFAFDPSHSDWDKEIVYQLNIPEIWKKWVLQLCKGNGEKEFALEKRIKPLGEKLKSIFPDLIMVNNELYRGTKKPWLIAIRPLPMNTLFILVKAWFFKTANEVRIPQPDDIDPSDFQWSTVTVGQACAEDSVLCYSLVPSLVAHQFCQSEKTLRLGEEDEPIVLKFSKVFAAREADCMSQPIRSRRGEFSYVVRFCLKTRGGEPNRQILLVSFGVRRIITKPVNTQKIKGKVHSTLLVSIDNPLEDKLQDDNVRSFASFSYRRQGNLAPYTRWKEGLDELFFDLLWGQSFTPEEIITNPERFGEGCNPRVIIVHNQQVYRSHLVGTGISIEEKRRFYEIVAAEFSQWVPLAPIPFIPAPKPSHTSSVKRNLLPSLLIPHSKEFVLEVWGPESLYDEVIKALREKKYNTNSIVEEDENSNFRLVSPSSNILTLIRRERHEYLDALDPTYGTDAYTHRVNYIQRTLEAAVPSKQVTLSLVEILPKESWEKTGEGADPKLAVREGFRRSGRITQFIYPESVQEDELEVEEEEGKSNYKHKVFNCILDLLSDAGAIDGKSLFDIGEIGPIISFDLIHVDRGIFPILTKLDQGVLYVRGEGIVEWLPLHQAILESHRLKSLGLYLNQVKPRLTRWLDEQLSWEKLHTGAFTLLIGAHLRNKGIWALTNDKVSKLLNPPIAPWIQEDPDINVIRINATDELPSYGFMPLSLSTGIYSDRTSGLYYGVGTKGVSQRRINKKMTKLHNPSKTFQQPRLVEYMPMGNADEMERERLAWAVHHLREMCISFETTLKFPYPLKMIRSIEKYIKNKDHEWDQNEAEFV